MPKYDVRLDFVSTADFTVEAESLEKAVEIARTKDYFCADHTTCNGESLPGYVVVDENNEEHFKSGYEIKNTEGT